MALHVLAYNLTRVHEHHGHPAAHGGDEDLAKPDKRLLNATPTKTATLRHFRQSVSTHQDPKRTSNQFFSFYSFSIGTEAHGGEESR